MVSIRSQTTLLCLLILVAIIIAVQQSDAQATQIRAPTRASFALPTIFDFERFKRLFRKSYRSLLENLARKRIFLARAFRVFASLVKYKYRKANSYLAINQMSDWTPEEWSKSKMRPDAVGVRRTADDKRDVEELAGADLDEIRRKFEEIELHSSEPGFREMAKELASSASRRKRDVSARDVSLEDLARRPTASHESIARVSSNNPNYQEPEFMSFGSDDNSREQDSLSERQISFIESLPGGSFLSSILESAGASFDQQSPAGELNLADGLPDELFIDHRSSNCLLAPRSQGKCGACYSFATMALYEWHYCNATGQRAAFSEQYIIDCGRRVGLRACDGGKFLLISDFVQRFGLELRQNYPYRVREDQCPYEADTPDSAHGYLRVYDNGFESIHIDKLEKQLADSPMVLNILLNDDFREYGGGVDDLAGCDKTDIHSVLLVGSGREDGQDYWLIRNSHSVSWGEAGYYKLNKRSRSCISPKFGFRLKNFQVPQSADLRRVSVEVRKRYFEYIEEQSEEVNKRRLRAEEEPQRGFMK